MPVKRRKGLPRLGLELRLSPVLAVDVRFVVSKDTVFEKPLVDDDVVDCRLGFASSLDTFGPPASEHATPCRTQFEHGLSSSHCERD